MGAPEVFQIIVTAVLTGAVSTIATVAALKVHIAYIREWQRMHEEQHKVLAEDSNRRHDKHETAIARAHERIDELQGHGTNR